MAFDARVAAAAKSDGAQPYEFTGMDGETYQLPPMGSLTGEQTLRFQDGDLTVIEEVADEATYNAVLAMPIAIYEDFGEDWGQSDGNLGKASSPPPQPNRAARRSAPTSRTKASTST